MMSIDEVNKTYDSGNRLLVILSVFICTFFIYKDFSIRMRFGWALLLLAVAISLLLTYKKDRRLERIDIRFNRLKQLFVLLCIVIIILFILPGARHDEDTISHIIAMFVTLLIILLANPSLDEIQLSERIFVIASFIYSLVIIFFKLFPRLYWSTVFNWISEPSQELALYYIPRGYGIPIGGSYTLADYVIAVGLIILTVRMLDTKEKLNRNFLLLFGLGLFFFIAIFAVGRRGELVATIIALFFLYLMPRSGASRKKKIVRLLGICLVLCLLLVLFYSQLKNISIFERYFRSIENLLTGKDASSGRLELWSLAISLFKLHPFVGVGYGGFAHHVTPEFRALHGEDVMNVHNIVLQFMSETGIIGTILFFTPIVWMFLIIYRRTIEDTKADIQSPKMKCAIYLGRISIGMQVYFFVLNMFDPSFYKLIFWSFYGITIILGIKSSSLSRSALAEKSAQEVLKVPNGTHDGTPNV